MNQLDIISELGDDADLLIKSDAWLLAQKLKISQAMTLLACDLRKILIAAEIKRKLQQTNLVAAMHTKRLPNAMLDAIIEIMPLPDAIKIVLGEPNEAQAQFGIWANDGYDIGTAALLRS